jgi:hypothetical protein
MYSGNDVVYDSLHAGYKVSDWADVATYIQSRVQKVVYWTPRVIRIRVHVCFRDTRSLRRVKRV